MSPQSVRAWPADMAHRLEEQNPWWSGRAMRPIPSFKRWPFEILRRRLVEGKQLAPVQVLRGPRQIGKTTLQEQLIETLLALDIAPTRILRLQFDDLKSLVGRRQKDPILALTRWFERDKFPGGDFNASARQGKPAFIFLDEVQNLADWSVQLKSLVDHSSVRVCVTGSSALRIALGADSLAGRLQTLEAGPLRLAEIAAVNGLPGIQPFDVENGYSHWGEREFWAGLRDHALKDVLARDQAFALFAERGGYPLAHAAGATWHEVAQQLNEQIIKRVIQHDLRVGERGAKRDEDLLREVFRISARLCGQTPRVSQIVEEVNAVFDAQVGAQRILAYLRFLDSSLLIKLVEPLEIRLKKRRNPNKICLSDHALRAAWLGERIQLSDERTQESTAATDVAGRVAESIVGAYLASMTNLRVNYIPASHKKSGQSEIDFVLDVGDRRVPIEVKYQNRIDPQRDIHGLQRYLDDPINRAEVGLLVVRSDHGPQVTDPRIVQLPLKSLLMLR
jgi:predicted AAA+ superfamily ATPase